MIAAAENKSLLAFDAAFPRRDEVLCADAMRKNFASILKKQIDSCEIVRVKYRPATSLRVLYRLQIRTEILLVTARVFSNNRNREVFENSKDQPNVFHDEKLNSIFWKFPSDRKIKQLEKTAAKISYKNELVAYAPEKCATFRYLNRVGEVFAYTKIFVDGGEGERIFSIYKNLKNVDGELFPKAACYSAKHRTLFVEAIKGVRLADLDAQKLSAAYQLFGESIARFHDLKTLENLREFSRHSTEKIFDTLEIIKQTLPEHFDQAENLARNIADKFEFADEEKVTLHGDVHTKNAIVRDEEKLTLIDLDQTSFGNASSDIGSFLGGLFYKEITGEISVSERKNFTEKFLAGYESVRHLPCEKSLNWHTVTAIFTERCGRAISRFRIEGLKNFARLLSLSEQIIDGGKI